MGTPEARASYGELPAAGLRELPIPAGVIAEQLGDLHMGFNHANTSKTRSQRMVVEEESQPAD